MRIALFALAAFTLLAGSSNAGDPHAAPLGQALLDLVRAHDADGVTSTSRGGRTTIALDAMTYQIHKPLKTGRLQAAVAEQGPREAGLVIEIVELAGPYGGPMELPQVLSGPCYPTHCNAIRENRTHYLVCARFGGALPEALRIRILRRMGMGSAATPRADRLAVPVTVTAEPALASHAAGKPLVVDLRLRNGLRGAVRFETFATAPIAWHGETTRIRLSEIRRNDSTKNLFRAAPAVNVPPAISGPRSFVIPPGGEFALQVDLAKWQIAGGWMPGTYACVLRMEQITIDERTRLSLASAPFHITVK